MANRIIDHLKTTEYFGKIIKNRKSNAMVFLIFVSLLSACSPLVSTSQPMVEKSIPLKQGSSIGQTFVANKDGLMGFRVYLEPAEEGDGEVILSLWSQPDSNILISTSALDLDLIQEPGFYEFSIEPIEVSRGEYFYAELKLNETGIVEAGVASHETYLSGALYSSNVPQDMQMAFNLSYHPGWALYGGFKEVISWVRLLLVGLVLFVIPGWGFLSMLWSGWKKITVIEKLILSSGLSIAIYPTALLWMHVLRIEPGRYLAWLPAATGFLMIAWCNRKTNLRGKIAALKSSRYAFELPNFLFFVIVGSIIFSRFWSVGTLDAPLWGDSYHHTMITQLIVDNNGLFDSWRPYAELDSFTYHFGFHASAAVFHWITGDQMKDSVLWVGQIFNILAVLVLFPLARKLAGNRWGGVAAVLFSGLLISLPMTYVDWGRYTQLTGQIILPVMMYITWEIFDRDEVSWKSLVIPSVLIAGLSLSHYRVLFFAIFFLAALFFFSLKRSKLNSLVVKVIFIGAGSLILFLPWLLRVYGSTILQIFKEQITTSPAAISQSTLDYNTIGDLTIYLPAWAWLLTGAAILIGLMKRFRNTLLVVAWYLLLLIGTNPNWIGLPGTGVLSNFALFIAIYIPAGLLVGLASGALIGETLIWNLDYRKYIAFGLVIFFLVLTYVGNLNRLGDVNIKSYALVTRPDSRAARWIRENVQEQAIFLVNSFLAYDGTLAVGSDGGLWLPLLADRDTTLPPITYGFESGSGADNLQRANNLLKTVSELGPTHPEVIDMLQEQNVSHVYIGQRRGGVNYAGETFDPQELLADPHFQPIYHQDLVWIFQIFP